MKSKLMLMSSFLLLLTASAVAHETSTACLTDQVMTETGHALLQVKSTKQHIDFDTPRPLWTLTGDMMSKGAGADAPLNESGYQEVAALCCNLQMFVFAKRLVEQLGLELCDEGGLAGLVIWYTCDPTNEADNRQSFSALQDDLLASKPPVKCAFVAPSGECPTKTLDCGGTFNASRFKECRGNATTTSNSATTTAIPLSTTITTSRPPPVCSRTNSTQLNFSMATVAHSNLGGVGPDDGKEEFRLAKIGKAGTPEQDLDLVVTLVRGNYNGNGGKKKGDFASIGMHHGLKGVFRFTFVATGTDTPVELNELLFTVLDVDGRNNNLEKFQAWGVDDYVQGKHSVVKVVQDANDLEFENRDKKNAVNPERNKDWVMMNLTKAQEDASIMLKYTKVSTFRISFAILPRQDPGDPGLGRTFLFTGMTSLVDECQEE